ncbi:MAG: NAD(P)-dependent oxidoreductase [Candidatus Nanopelagicales bacterium]
MRELVFGAGGLVGSGYLKTGGLETVAPSFPIPWSAPQESADLVRRAASHHASLPGAWRIVWAAGIGRVGAPRELLEQESSIIQALVETVASAPTASRGQLIFASSAGALYSGHGSSPIYDSTPPNPSNDYGIVKNSQEQLLRPLADTGLSVAICRLSNVYGTKGSGQLGGGIVSAGIRAALRNTPLQMYVSADNRRDYIYSEDAARLARSFADSIGPGLHATLICANTTRTLVEVLQTVGRVARRRVPVVYAERPETAMQPRVLQMRSGHQGVPLTPFPAAISRMIDSFQMLSPASR